MDSTYIVGLLIACIVLSSISILLSLVATALSLALKWRTHRTTFIPLDPLRRPSSWQEDSRKEEADAELDAKVKKTVDSLFGVPKENYNDNII